jgi:LysM repeat protein
MRLRLFLTGVVAVAAVAAVPDALAASGKPQTAGLQVALRAQGLYHGAIDAIAGPHTVAAVRAFQRIHHLPVTGVAGTRTRRQLGPLGRPLFGKRTLRRGDFGWDVAVLQFLLVRDGISVPVNAYFDGPTLLGVRRLQRRRGLAPDGVVGPRTVTALRRQHAAVSVGEHTVATRVHVVRKGESLWLLAKRYHTTVPKLARLNHLDPARPLLAGTRLHIPARAHEVAATPVAYHRTSVDLVRSLLDSWARHYGVSARLVRALAWMESGYNNSVVSPAGAHGIMQILPTTWRYVETVLIGHRVRHTAEGNVHVGVAYLSHLLRDFHGNERLALAAWYQGEGAVRESGVLRVSRRFVADVLALQQRV